MPRGATGNTRAAPIGSEMLTSEKYRSIFDYACDAILIYDMNTGAILDANDKASKLYGYTLSETRTADFGKLSAGWYPYNSEGAMERIRQARNDGQQLFEWLARDSFGRLFWIEVNFNRAEIDGKDVILAFVRDIAERKKTEQRLALQYTVTRALSEAASLTEATPLVLQSICEHVGWDHGEVWFVDTEKSVLRRSGEWNCSSEFCTISRNMTFARGVGLPGRIWAEERPIWITDVANEPDFIRITAASEAGIHAAFGFPIRSEGSIIGCMIFFSRTVQAPKHDLLDMFQSIGSQIGDFIKRKQAEEELRNYAAELERSNKELQQFAYIASHDLQEPLRTVSGFVELLRKKYQGQLDEKADKYISFAVEGAHRMSTLISDLLAYSRVGTQAVGFGPVDMNAVIKQAIDNLKVAIQESQAVITSDDLPEVTGDRTRLVQLLQNLIGNAVKFRKTDAQLQIRISAGAAENEWTFGIHDNGIGIKAEYFDRIFVIFQRLHPREAYAGTGVGLAICKKVIELHKGRIWVESKPGEGSSFYFSLPFPRPIAEA